jgi:hypothetical protein
VGAGRSLLVALPGLEPGFGAKLMAGLEREAEGFGGKLAWWELELKVVASRRSCGAGGRRLGPGGEHVRAHAKLPTSAHGNSPGLSGPVA